MAFCSNYKSSLTHFDLVRYEEKVKVCGFDPYDLETGECSSEIKELPGITQLDIFDYFVTNQNFVTKQEMKNLKGLSAHTFFTSGHVQRPLLVKVASADLVVVLGKVKHSQTHSAEPLKSWLLVRTDGEIVCGHCTCMAGRGETCSHIGAISFAIEYVTKVRDSQACTDQLNAWLPPNLQDVPKKKVQDMDFSSADARWRKLPGNGDDMADTSLTRSNVRSTPPSTTAISNFFEAVKKASRGRAGVVLSTFSDHCEPFIPPEMDAELPKLMDSLYDTSLVNCPYAELVQKAREVIPEMKATEEQVKKVEQLSRSQRSSTWWGKFKMGRIGGSVMKLVCRADIANPARSTLNTIVSTIQPNGCMPKDCERGIQLEPLARQKYQEGMSETHQNFSVVECGFFLCKTRAYLGSSPDGIVNCDCCEGQGGLEIKSPRQENFLKSLDENGNLVEDHEHQYQVQTAILVCDFAYVDYFLYCPVKDAHGKMQVQTHQQRILPNEVLIQEILSLSEFFFIYCVLPELMAKHFSVHRPPLAPSNVDLSGQTVNVCFCQTPRRDPLVVCADGRKCFGEYHLRCLGKTTAPPNWKCDICKVQRVGKIRGRRNSSIKENSRKKVK